MPRWSGGLFLDLYHVDSAAVSHRAGTNGVATFDLYARSHPFDGGFLLVAGLEPALEFVRAFAFSPDDLAYLRGLGRYDGAFLDELSHLRFTGEILAMPEGTVAFADEPLLRVSAPFREALLLESGLLRLVGISTLIATRAARAVHAARGRPVAEFALRRAPEPFLTARAAFIGGCASTSFLGAAEEFGLEPSGTIPHALVQQFATEEGAFRAAAETLDRYTLLLDTYAVARAIRTAIAVAREARERWGHTLAAVRLDSGDIAADSRHVRAALDEAGMRDVRILASGELDEFKIDALLQEGAPIDSFGVGASIGSPGGALSAVYKLVWYEGDEGARAAIKHAGDKSTWPGRKAVYRIGEFEGDVIALEGEPAPTGGPPLLEPVMRAGEQVRPNPPLEAARERARAQLDALPGSHRALTDPSVYPVRRTTGLLRLREEALRGLGLTAD